MFFVVAHPKSSFMPSSYASAVGKNSRYGAVGRRRQIGICRCPNASLPHYISSVVHNHDFM